MPPKKRKLLDNEILQEEPSITQKRYTSGKHPRIEDPLPLVDYRNPIDPDEELFKDKDWTIPKLDLYITYTLDNLVEAYKPIFKDFIKLPSRKFHPQYFYKIEQPISINEIKSRDYEYRDGERQFLLDVELIQKNCFAYNDPDSLIVKNSAQVVFYIKNEVLKAKNITRNYLISDNVKERLSKIITILFNLTEFEIANIMDEEITNDLDNQILLCEPFMELVDQDEFPDYYEVTHKPISLSMIQSNLELGYYSKIYDFYIDMSLVFQNAQVFNSPDSLLYQDSNKLLKCFHKLMNEKFFPDIKDSQERGEISLEYDKIEYEQYLANGGDNLNNESDDNDNDLDDYDFNHYEGLGNGYNRTLFPSDYLLGPNKLEGDLKKKENLDQKDEQLEVLKYNFLSCVQHSNTIKDESARNMSVDSFIYEIIKGITISSSKSVYEQSTKYLQGSMPSVNQDWFEYSFLGRNIKSTENQFAFTLPPIQTSLSFIACVNCKISLDNSIHLLINKEKINPVSNLDLGTSETQFNYEIRLSEGLNDLEFVVKDMKNDKIENVKFWISVLP